MKIPLKSQGIPSCCGRKLHDSASPREERGVIEGPPTTIRQTEVDAAVRTHELLEPGKKWIWGRKKDGIYPLVN